MQNIPGIGWSFANDNLIKMSFFTFKDANHTHLHNNAYWISSIWAAMFDFIMKITNNNSTKASELKEKGHTKETIKLLQKLLLWCKSNLKRKLHFSYFFIRGWLCSWYEAIDTYQRDVKHFWLQFINLNFSFSCDFILQVEKYLCKVFIANAKRIPNT